MDPTILVRKVAIELRTSPKSILIPISTTRERAIDDWTLSNNDPPAESLLSLAQSYEGPWDGTTAYFQGASDLLDRYLALDFNTTAYFTHVANEAIERGENEDDVADVLSIYYESIEVTRPRMTGHALRQDAAYLIRSDKAAYDSLVEEYVGITRVEGELDAIEPMETIRGGEAQTRVETRVLHNGSSLTRDSLGEIMRSLILDEVLTYASLRNGDEAIYQVRDGIAIEEPPLASSHQEILLLVRRKRVILDAVSSSIKADDRNLVELVLSHIPSLEVTDEVSLETVTLVYPVDELIPTVLYYLIRQYEPWKTLMGVNDSQYARKAMRDLSARVTRWPLHGTTVLTREDIVPIVLNYGTNVVSGGMEDGLSFTIKDVSHLVVARVEELASRLVMDYFARKEEIEGVYAGRFPNLLIPREMQSMTSGRILKTMYPDIFGAGYKSACKKRPVIATKDEEDAVEVELGDSKIYLRCPARHRLQVTTEGDRIIPCCVPDARRKIINASTHLEKGAEGYLFGVAPIFGKEERSKKGTSSVVRVGVGKDLKKALHLILGKQLEKPLTLAPFLQSMWDYTEDEIKQYLEDATWESDLVIDGIALNVKANIFVFELSDDRLILRVPRYRFAYYLPYYYDRPSYFLYRHPGVEGVYELIRPVGGQYKSPPETSVRAIEWVRSQRVTELVNRDGTYASLEDRAPYTEESGVVRGVQIIDTYGKLRGYQDKDIIHYFPHPSIPLVGPHVRRGDEAKNRESYTKKRMREGVTPLLHEDWKNIPLGGSLLALPTTRRWQGDKNEGTTTELSWGSNTVSHYAQLARQRSYILQLTNWVFANAQSEVDLELFQQYMFVREGVTYNFDFLPPELGPYQFNAAIEYIQETGLGRVVEDEEGKIGFLVYPSEKVMRGVLRMLKVGVETHGSNIPIPDRLVGVDYSFTKSHVDEKGLLHRQLYLRDNESYESWSNSSLAYSDELVSNLNDPQVRNRRYPYTLVSLTMSQERERWLVQNVSSGSYLRAFQCCATWLRSRRNTGYFTQQAPDEDEEIQKYVVVYTWNESGLLTSDVRVGSNVITLLVYPGYKREGANSYKGHFAALLPLTSS